MVPNLMQYMMYGVHLLAQRPKTSKNPKLMMQDVVFPLDVRCPSGESETSGTCQGSSLGTSLALRIVFSWSRLHCASVSCNCWPTCRQFHRTGSNARASSFLCLSHLDPSSIPCPTPRFRRPRRLVSQTAS